MTEFLGGHFASPEGVTQGGTVNVTYGGIQLLEGNVSGVTVIPEKQKIQTGAQTALKTVVSTTIDGRDEVIPKNLFHTAETAKVK